MAGNSGKLMLVPTPIGNLGDMTYRAIETLREVDIVLSEDTRVMRKLLSHFKLQATVDSLHQNNEHAKVPHWVTQLLEGKTLAYCTDAGTPGISDPGFLLIRAALEKGIEVECLPGSTAFVPALVASGLPCDRFVFEGFLPHKKGRQKRWEVLKLESRTMVLYESPHRIFKLLEEIITHLGPERQISIGRELSKIHETYYRGTAAEVTSKLKNDVVKGEFVVVLSGSSNE